MKNCLILHGTNNNSQKHWFPWLKAQLEDRGYAVWVPDLPDAHEPNPTKYVQCINDSNWVLDTESVLVGHSSGAVAILHLLQSLKEGVTVNTAILVGAFKDNLGVKELSRLFDTPFDFEKIKKWAQRIIFIHSDNDPYCPLDHAEYLAERLGAELIVMSGEGHFSISTAGEKYKEFPALLTILME